MERALSESSGILSAVEFILSAQSPGSGLPPCNPSFLEAHHIVSGSLANSNVHRAFLCLLPSHCFPAVISFVGETLGASAEEPDVGSLLENGTCSTFD